VDLEITEAHCLLSGGEERGAECQKSSKLELSLHVFLKKRISDALIMLPDLRGLKPINGQTAKQVGEDADGVPVVEARPFAAVVDALIGHVNAGRDEGVPLGAVVNVGGIQISGYFAWLFWNAVHLYKLVGLKKQLQVAGDWVLGLIFPRDAAIVRRPGRCGICGANDRC